LCFVGFSCVEYLHTLFISKKFVKQIWSKFCWIDLCSIISTDRRNYRTGELSKFFPVQSWLSFRAKREIPACRQAGLSVVAGILRFAQDDIAK
jgi:hypothetical protein